MSIWYWLLALSAGTIAGVFLAALLSASKNAEAKAEVHVLRSRAETAEAMLEQLQTHHDQERDLHLSMGQLYRTQINGLEVLASVRKALVVELREKLRRGTRPIITHIHDDPATTEEHDPA